MAIDDQLAVLLAQNAELFATYEEWANGQIMLLAGTVDDPNSFNEVGGKTGALGYYPVVNVSGQTIYVPCMARLRALALGGENAEGFEELVAQVGGKLAAVDNAVAQAGTATTLAVDKAGLADAKATLAGQKAAAAQTVVDAGANILAAVPVTQTAQGKAEAAAIVATTAASRFNTVFESLDTTQQQSPLEIHDTKHRVLGAIAMLSDLSRFSKPVLFESMVDPALQPALVIDAKNRILIAGGGGGASASDGPFLDANGLPKVHLYNAHKLRRTAMKMRQLKDGVAGTQLRAAIFGDSWVQSGFKWGRNFARSMWTRFGKAGSGFFPANNAAALDTLLTVNAFGAWVGNDDRSAFYPTPDMLVRTSSTAGNSVVITADASLPVPSAIKLFFVGTADGAITYKVNNGAEVAANVQSAGTLIILSIPAAALPTTGGWTITIKVSAGTVRFGGGRVEGAGTGVIIDACGFGGTTSTHWLTPDATQWQAGVASLDPDLVIILLNTNDKLTGGDADTFAANIKTLVGRARAGKPVTGGTPYCDVLVVLATNIASAGALVGEAYAQATMKVAQANDFAVLDLARVFGNDPASYIGWFSDPNHPDLATGGELINDQVLKAIGA